MRRMALVSLPLAVAGGLTACSHSESPSSIGPIAPDRGFPALRVSTVVGGLDHPWDVKPIGHHRLLVTERDRARLSLVDHHKRRTVAFPSSQVWVAGAADAPLGVWPGVAERPDVRYVVRDWWAKLQLVAAGLAITTASTCVRAGPCATAATTSTSPRGG